jgi:hypothetical protein
MGEQPQPERKIELCTPNIVDLPIINLQDTGRPFKIKVSTIRMMIAEAFERFNEYMRAEFFEWSIGLLKRRMEKMEIEKEAQYIKVAKARSTCEVCEEYDHVQGKPRFKANDTGETKIKVVREYFQLTFVFNS